jgi:integrase
MGGWVERGSGADPYKPLDDYCSLTQRPDRPTPKGRFRGPFFAAREAIDHEDLHCHDLRHFGGVIAAVTGATTKEVTDRLGHTTSTAAMQYQRVAANRADALAERLSARAVTVSTTRTKLGK